MTVSRLVTRGLNTLDKALQWAAVALLAVVVFAVMCQVIARYVTTSSTAWTSELATLGFVWLAMLAIPIGIRRGRHMVLDVWEYLKYRRWFDRMISTVAAVIVVGTFALLAYVGFDGAGPAFSRTLAGLGISHGWIALAVPVGSIFSAIFAIEAWWRVFNAPEGVDPLDDPILNQPDDVVVIKGEL